MRDIERRLRESLEARAGDVEPTPVLWERVQARVRRNRWWTWTLAAASTAAVVLAAVAVVPGLIDGQNDVEIMSGPTASPTTPAGDDEPTAGPTEGDDDPAEPDEQETITPTSVGGLSHLVVTDGTTITLVDAAGEPVRELVALAAEGESTVVAVEVRPGSTAEDLTVVFAAEGEGMVDLRWVRLRDGAVEGPEYFEEGHQVTSDTIANGTLTPTFSPDGRHLAWLEVPRGEPQQPARLQTIGWSDEGPGTGSSTNDNAGFELEPVDTEHPLTLEDWIWDEVGEDGTARGELRAVGPAGLYHITIERQGDGALAMPSDAVRLGGGGDGAVVDIDNAYAGDAPHQVPSPGPEYQLLAQGDGSGDAEGIAYTLLRQPPGGPTVEWPLSDLGPSADPWGTWMNAHPDAVVIGFGGDAWLVTEEGATSLPGTIHWADVVR